MQQCSALIQTNPDESFHGNMNFKFSSNYCFDFIGIILLEKAIQIENN